MNAALTFTEVCTLAKFTNYIYLPLNWVRWVPDPALFLLRLRGDEEWVTKMKKPHICWRRSGDFLHFAGQIGEIDCSLGTWQFSPTDVRVSPWKKSPRVFVFANGTLSRGPLRLLVCSGEWWRRCRLIAARRMSFAGRVAGRRRRSPSCSSLCSPRPAGPKKRRVTEPTTSTLF